MRLKYDPAALRRVSDAAGTSERVAVLLGGDSSEREISLLSGNAVLGALERRGVDAHAFDTRDGRCRNCWTSALIAFGSRCTAPAERTARCKVP